MRLSEGMEENSNEDPLPDLDEAEVKDFDVFFLVFIFIFIK